MMTQPEFEERARRGIPGWKVVVFMLIAAFLFAVVLLVWGLRVRDHLESPTRSAVAQSEIVPS